MRYVNAKSVSELKLVGVTVTFDMVNDSLKAVYFRDAEGNHCRVVIEGYTGIFAQVPAPPKTEKRHVLRADLPVLGKIRREFDDRFEADQAKRELEAKFRDSEIAVTEEDVPVPDGSEDAKNAADDIPF